MEAYDLLKCIDNGLNKFGPSVKQTIYWKITILHGSLQNAIVDNPSIFIGVMREIFRDSAIGVERIIMEEIRNTFDLADEDTGTLGKTIELAKEQITPVSNLPNRLLVASVQTPK